MDWIRKNPHLVVLIIIAVGVMAASGLVYKQSQDFNETFAPVMTQPVPGTKIPPIDYAPLEAARGELEKPGKWVAPVDPEAKDSRILPFVPNLYSVKDGRPVRFGQGSTHMHRLTKEPIPDAWFLVNGLPVTDITVPLQDPDEDGFFNEDEWLAKTDPKKADSHPPYLSKLYFKSIERIPFRLRFNGMDGDPAKDKIADISFQINTLDLKQPTEFLKIGQMVPRTVYKLEKFEPKSALNEKIGEQVDVSELTLLNSETNDRVVLVRDKVVNSPDVYVHLWYVWPKNPIEIRVKKAGKFVLLPEKEQIYLVLDIKDNEALIKTPAGAEATVRPAPPEIAPK